MIELLDSHILRSITPDRGKEFAQHRLVTEALGVEFYFPEPHQPWTRGTNENTNGLLREYFPKHQDINQWSEVDIQQVINKLNLRPRKCLGWKHLMKFTSKIVALGLTIQDTNYKYSQVYIQYGIAQ